MKRTHLAIGVVGAFALTAGAAECPRATVTETSPAVDGVFDEACWKDAEWHRDFCRRGVADRTQATEVPATEFAVVADSHAVYFAVRCFEKDVGKVRDFRCDPVWFGNDVEFFLTVDGTTDTYYHFAASPNTERVVNMFYAEAGGIAPDPYAPKWEHAFGWEKDAWTMEVRIPFSSLYMTRNANWSTDWHVNVTRTLQQPHDLITWSKVELKFHEPGNFRTISGFPMRLPEDDIAVRGAVAEMKGASADGLTGELKLDVYTTVAGEYEVTTSAGAPKRVTLVVGENTVGVPCAYRENGRAMTRIALRNLANGRVAERTYPVIVDYRPVRVKFTLPQYRDNFYPGQCADRVAGHVAVVAAGPAKLTLEGPGFPTRTVTVDGEGDFDFDTRGFGKGEAWLTVEADGLKERFRVRNLPPTGHDMMWIEDGHLVFNGRAVIPRRIYAEELTNGRAFGRRRAADAKELAKTDEAGNTLGLAAIRILPGSERSEGVKDMRPTARMLAAIDRVIAANRDKDFSAYYICDEPECRSISPVWLKHYYEYVREADPYHPCFVASRAGKTYVDCADWFETHPYLGCGWREDGTRRYGTHPRDVGSYLDAFGLWDRPDKCVGFLPTAFGYVFSSFKNDYPTFDEYVLHVWAGLARGAKSLWPYAGLHMGDRPGVYEGVKYTFSSVAALEDLLLFGKKTVFAKGAESECVVFEKDGEKLLVLLNYLTSPLEAEIPAGVGSLREFRGARTFVGGDCVTLKPFEALVATTKARDAGLRPLAAVAAQAARDEFARTHRDNQLLMRFEDVVCETNLKRPYNEGSYKLIDGTRDIFALQCSRHVKKPYATVVCSRFAPRFDTVRLFGDDLPDFTVSVPDGDGWRRLAAGAVRHEGPLAELTLAERVTAATFRLDFQVRTAKEADFELYEIELPRLTGKPVRIDLGRQLFVDDFLIAATNGVVRHWDAPVKATDPVIRPTDEKTGRVGGCTVATNGGLWWDPKLGKYRVWYETDWAGNLRYAESQDGLAWEYPDLGKVKGTNRVFGDDEEQRDKSLDSWSVWPDYKAADPYSRWNMFISPPGGVMPDGLFVSSDGRSFRKIGIVGYSPDRSTMHFDAILDAWVFSLRDVREGIGRCRRFFAQDEFRPGECPYAFPIWDVKVPEGSVEPPAWKELEIDYGKGGALYAFDAVPYESLMLGVMEVLHGIPGGNAACERVGLPKQTSLRFAFSRDGKTYRPAPESAIRPSGWGSGKWDTGYLSAMGGICAVGERTMRFYYSGLRGDAEMRKAKVGVQPMYRQGMYFNGAIGYATLRRDGFVGLVADGAGEVVTRPVVFSGKHLFVNAECMCGEVSAEILDEKGEPIPGFAADDCRGLKFVDSTKRELVFRGGDFAALAGRSVAFRFRLHCATLYSFWVSPSARGESHGYVAAGGPAYPGLRDL